MIKCDVKKNNLRMEGHSGYAKSGEDIVCAGASMLVYAICDKMLQIDKDTKFFEDEIGKVELTYDNSNEKLKLLFETLINGLKMLQEQYPDNIKIKEAK